MATIRMSRFPIHDDLTAPEESLPVLKSASSAAGQLPNFLGVLAGSPASLRGYARLRRELRAGVLALPTLERLSLAVAAAYGNEPGLALHRRTARRAGLGLDEIAAAEEWTSGDERHALLLGYLRHLVVDRGRPPAHLHEEAKEAGWTDEELLESIAYATLEVFKAMIDVASDVPPDGSVEVSRQIGVAA